MGWIWSVCCEKFRHDFVAWTFVLIAPFQPVLHRVSQDNKTVPNASKQYETYQNISLGSNGVDMERSLWKISTRLRGTNIYINCTISARFCIEFQWATKQSQKHPNSMKCTKTWVQVAMGWIGSVRCEKFQHDFVARTFASIAPVQPILLRVSCSSQIHQNTTKRTKTRV